MGTKDSDFAVTNVDVADHVAYIALPQGCIFIV
jgi:hypothetical protein